MVCMWAETDNLDEMLAVFGSTVKYINISIECNVVSSLLYL